MQVQVCLTPKLMPFTASFVVPQIVRLCLGFSSLPWSPATEKVKMILPAEQWGKLKVEMSLQEEPKWHWGIPTPA